MKVFICWSGDDSKELAEELRQLIHKIFPRKDVKVELSYDLRTGQVWLPGLIKKLGRTQFGVLCVTPSNLNSDWLLFEAGVLFMTTTFKSDKCLCPYLMGVRPSDLPAPLGMFQAVTADEAGTLKLLDTLVEVQTQTARPVRKKLDQREREIFKAHWGHTRAKLAAVRERLEPKKIKVSKVELLTLVESHKESVIFRIQERARDGYLHIVAGMYDSKILLGQIANAIEVSQNFYTGIVGARLGKDVAGFLKENYNEVHLGPAFEQLEREYVQPLIDPGRESPPEPLEMLITLQRLLLAIELAVEKEFTKLRSELLQLEW
jgi:hypothetical protein